MYTINFLEKRRKNLSKLEKQDRKILKYTSVLFGVVLVIVLVLFGTRYYFNTQVAQAMVEQKRLEQEVLAKEDTEEAFLFFVNKLGTLEKLFAERKDKQAAIEYFSQVFGPEVIVQNISYDAGKGAISFGLQAKDVFTLESVMEILSSPQTNDVFNQVKKSDLRRTPEGIYTIRVDVTFASDQDET